MFKSLFRKIILSSMLFHQVLSLGASNADFDSGTVRECIHYLKNIVTDLDERFLSHEIEFLEMNSIDDYAEIVRGLDPLSFVENLSKYKKTHFDELSQYKTTDAKKFSKHKTREGLKLSYIEESNLKTKYYFDSLKSRDYSDESSITKAELQKIISDLETHKARTNKDVTGEICHLRSDRFKKILERRGVNTSSMYKAFVTYDKAIEGSTPASGGWKWHTALMVRVSDSNEWFVLDQALTGTLVKYSDWVKTWRKQSDSKGAFFITNSDVTSLKKGFSFYQMQMDQLLGRSKTKYEEIMKTIDDEIEKIFK